MAVVTDSFIVLFIMGWGLLLLLAFFGACVRAICSGVHGICVGNERARISEDFIEDYYMALSPGSEFDSLLKNTLLHYLSRFTLTLGEEHMLCRLGSQNDTMSTNESVMLDVSNEEVETGDIDNIEDDEGCFAEESNPKAAAAVEYTHVSLPLPGYDIEGMSVCRLEGKEDRPADGEASTPSSKANKWKLTSLFRRTVDDGKEKETEPTTVKNESNQHKMTEKRSVPIFCAICLDEYKIFNRVCWASNPECSHVFHEDCILQWLISLGKKKLINPTDERLLKYLLCPCCRQNFVSVKPVLRSNDECV